MKKFQTQAQKEFQKMKRFVEKRFPGAHTMAKQSGKKLEYVVLDGNGYAIIDPELMLPPAYTVRKAWEQAKYAAWFTNMIRKSNNAFSDEKMLKKIAKETGDY
jgi:hypothetical protein